MSRGASSGGGQSSLGYLFGSGGQPPSDPPPSPSKVVEPPYGIDKEDESRPVKPPEKPENKKSDRVQGQNSGQNVITDRPTTKVNSVPGGDSSLGYLFGDK